MTSTSAGLGYSPGVAEDQWSLLVRAAAMFRLTPDRVTVDELAAVCRDLRDAEDRHRPERLAAKASITKPAHGLRAVLFHAGLIDDVPKRHAAWSGRAQAEAEWASVAGPLAATMHTYLAQCALTQRPKTATRNVAALRELGVFLAGHAPEVTCVADLRRPHLEAYKTWLAQRPVKRPSGARPWPGPASRTAWSRSGCS